MTSRISLFVLLSFGVTASVFADVVNLGANHDNTIFQNNVNNSSGGGAALFVGTNGTTSPRRGLISFDLSSIPSGSTINSVQLTLTVGMIAGGGSGPVTRGIDLFSMTSAWGEGTVQNGQTTLSGSGNGAGAAAGNATWNQSSFGSTNWTTPGGDHALTASASQSRTVSLGDQFIFASTAQLVSDVQGWLNTPSTNSGWEMISQTETTATQFLAFYSREGTSITTPAQVVASQLPSLQVTYSVPEPAAGSLAMLAGIALLGSRATRRRARSVRER